MCYLDFQMMQNSLPKINYTSIKVFACIRQLSNTNGTQLKQMNETEMSSRTHNTQMIFK